MASDGTLVNPFPFAATPELSPMKQDQMIPFYAPDGSSLGFRVLDAAQRLIASGCVKPAYGRKKHLKAIFLQREDGSSPVETHARTGTRYSFLERLDDGGRCWKLRRVDQRDDDGVLVNTHGVFLQVVADCMVP
jgi:hypothetical protein